MRVSMSSFERSESLTRCAMVCLCPLHFSCIDSVLLLQESYPTQAAAAGGATGPIGNGIGNTPARNKRGGTDDTHSDGCKCVIV
jgi:hypothetical protein